MPFPSVCRISVEESVNNIMVVHLYVICCFSIVSVQLLVSVCFLLGVILPETLHFLDLVDYFLSNIREVFSYCFFKQFLWCFLLSGTPIVLTVVHSMLFLRSLRLSFFFFFHSFFYIPFCSSDFHHSVLQVMYPFFCLSYSAIDSLQCSVLLCSLVLLSVWQTFLAPSQSLPPFFPPMFLDHLYYHYYLNYFFLEGCISPLLWLFWKVLAYPFIWDKTLCFFILINFLQCDFWFNYCGIMLLLASSVFSLVDETKRLV